jgi:Tol biopolymer transport system component
MAMIKNGSAGGSDLYRVEERIDGTWSKTRVTTKIDWDYFPAWSPDNSWIVWGISPVQYHDYENPTYEIWAMPAAGGTPLRLTKDGYADNFPSWGPPRP